MAETIKNQEPLHIPKPQPGQSSVLAVDPGTTIYLDFPLDQVEFAFQDGNLIFRFEGGEQVELQNFEEVLSSTDLFLADGTELSGDQILEAFQPAAGEPAAGAGPLGGGVGEYDDYLGDIADGIDRLGTLNPREFGGGYEEPNIEALEFEEPGEPTPTPEPPQAFDDFQDFLVQSLRNEDNEVFVRFFDIDGTGNVLDNDTPEGGVSVIGFSIDGSEYGPESLGQWISLDVDSNGIPDAQFRLSADGTYRFIYDNFDTILTDDETLNLMSPSSPPIDTGDSPVVRFCFNDVDPFDWVEFVYNDGTSPTDVHLFVPLGMVSSDGTYEIIDEDGIDNVQINFIGGDGVTLDSVDIVTDGISQETINYTIVDNATGLTSSANLILSFETAPPPETQT